ncbi:MAG: tetratricopeptide repeat protein [Phycisphaerae bacterium]|nr:tetratricopeptide repeat protein [Phycisphaerae bacterium]
MASVKQSQALYFTLAKPLVAVCAVLLALLAGEAMVRIFGLTPGLKPIELDAYDCFYKRSTNPILGFELKANCRHSRPDFIQTYERTNSHGQRDAERTLSKPEGVRRVLLLGDSVVEGYGLREEDTLGRQLEGLYPQGSTEVLNFGVSAYCTLAEVELLRTKGLQFDPDVVVLVFVENDYDNFNREAFPLGAAADRPAFVKALFKRSHLFRLASIQFNLFHFQAETDPVRWNQDAIGGNNVARGLQRFRELADRHGFQALVAIWPRFLDDRIEDVCFMPQDGDQLVVEHLAAMVGLPSVRLSEFFRQHREASARTVNPRLQYSAGDELHPSPAGCRVAAEALHKILADLDAGHTSLAHGVPRSPQVDAAAMAASRALGQTQPNYARVYNRLGTEFLKQGKLTEAAAQFRQAVAADPSHAGAHNNLGIAYERLGRQDAQAEYQQAIQLQPDFTHAHYNLARSLLRAGQESEAVTELRRTIQIDPNHVGALNMLGTVLGKRQRFVEAQSLLERAVRCDPNHAEARSNLGAAYAGQGRLQEAVAQFEAALSIDPDDSQAQENLDRVKAALQP